MGEFKPVLEQVRDQLRPPPGSFERLVARRKRRRRGQRLGASVLALVVATAGVVLAVRALGPTRGPQPASGTQGGPIAFSRGEPDGGLYVMNPDGTGLKRLTDESGDAQPVWSPDGLQLAFVRFHEGNEDINVMEANGSGIRKLTSDGASSSPAWSPDGTKIAFARETRGNADIYVMDANGKHVSSVTHDPLLEYTPAWSPDGATLAFVGYSKGPPPSPTRLYVIGADGSGTRGIGPENVASPSWSPDGTKIAFVDENTGSIYVINADGTGLRRIVDLAKLPGGSNFRPNFTSRSSWSPDGIKIAFAAGDATSSHLYVTNADGSELVQLTHGAVSDEQPAWSPVRSSPRPTVAKEVIDMSFADGAMWALTCDQGCTGDRRQSIGSALRIDPASGSILASVALSNPSQIAVGEGGAWVISFRDGTVTRINLATGQVAATIKLRLPFAVCETCPDPRDFLPYDVAVGEGSVWVDTARGVLARIDPATNQVAAQIKLPGDSTGELSVGEGAVWVTENVLGLYRIDPATNEISAKITTDDEQGRRLSVDQVTVGGGAVFMQGAWARKTTTFGHVEYVLASGAAIARIDPATNGSVVVFPVGAEPRLMAFDDGALWLWRFGGTTLERMDPETGSVTATVDTPAGGHFVAVGQGYGWVAMPEGTLTRVSLPTG